VQHRPAPHDGGVAGREHADRDHLDAVHGLRRHDHVFDPGRAVLDPEHPRHRVAVDVRVDHAYGEPAHGQRRRQVDGDARLADPALATGHGVHAGTRAGLGERDHRLGVVAVPVVAAAGAQPGLQFLPLFGGHRPEVDIDGGDTGHRHRRGRDVLPKFVLERAAGDGEQDADVGHPAGIDRHRADHAQFGDRPADLRILHRGEGGGDGVVERCRWG
jgi:hypothetical protein